jgi:hypothetical protein
VTATADRLHALAADVGRLRRRVDPASYAGFLAWRVAGHVDSLDAMLEPTAAERVAAGVDVEEALELVDTRTAELRRLLGDDTAGSEQDWERTR